MDSLETQLRLLLVEWKDEEKRLAQKAKNKPDTGMHLDGQSTGIMRCRVELEVILQKMNKTFPTTLDGEVLDGEIVTPERALIGEN
ncbi:hypothetical protein [Vibrio thalassae]|nr:hypothetical protein [Vibrio thalassae]